LDDGWPVSERQPGYKKVKIRQLLNGPVFSAMISSPYKTGVLLDMASTGHYFPSEREMVSSTPATAISKPVCINREK
jgi:hypothetical protein